MTWHMTPDEWRGIPDDYRLTKTQSQDHQRKAMRLTERGTVLETVHLLQLDGHCSTCQPAEPAK